MAAEVDPLKALLTTLEHRWTSDAAWWLRLRARQL